MVNAELKDLYKAVRIYCIIIDRLGDKLKDRNNMLDARADALYMIKSYEEEYDLSKTMKKFLIHRITQTMLSQNNM